ncbi:MAG: ABC transporter substrate-binding protein [Clostridia bacterium]|nr:ABC transporter substrate-binding protein [Clostridia bacterium]
MKNTSRFIALALALMLLTGSLALAENAQPTVDRAGNEIVLPEEINRVVSLAPSTTQLLIDLGLQDKLVAVDTYSAMYYEEVADLLQYDMMTPDNEALALLEPDVIFVTGMSFAHGENPFQPLIDLGACVAVLPSSYSIEDIRLDIAFIADVMDVEEEGAAIIAEMNEIIEAVKAIGETIEDKKTVLFEISALPYIYGPGDHTYLDEMIELIGAVNVLDGQDDWVFVSEEAALVMNPDVILTSTDYIEDPIGEILSREGWDSVTAVADKAVYPISSQTSNQPNQHIVEALVDMARAVYPEAYEVLDEAA